MEKYLFLLLVLISQLGLAQNQEVRVKPDVIEHEVDSSNVYDTYGSNYDLRRSRKMGAGFQVGGGLGVGGVLIEINIQDQDAALMGVGNGPGYGTVQALWRRSFEGKYFTPYSTAGWARWYNTGNPDDYKNSVILDRVLNEDQKSTSRFAVDFLTASLGMQYQELGGTFEGSSFFVEFTLIGALGRFSPLPSGAIGTIYYF